MKYILIACATQDAKNANQLSSKLKKQGYKTKIFPNNFGNSTKPKDMEIILQNSSMLILMYSDFAEKSTQLSKLITLAWDMNLKTVPFKIANVKRTLSSGIFLHQIEWVDAFEDGFDDAYDVLLEIIQENKINPKAGNRNSKSQKKTNLKNLYIAGAAILVLGFFALFFLQKSEKEPKKNTPDTTPQISLPANQVDFTDTGNINDLNETDKKLVGTWIVADYFDNQPIPKEDKEAIKRNIIGVGKLIFNADKNFFRIGFTPQVQKAKWDFNLSKKQIGIIIGDKTEPINLANFSDSTFTLLSEEAPNSANATKIVTKITFKKIKSSNTK